MILKISYERVPSNQPNQIIRFDNSTRHLSPRGRSLQSVLLVARGLIELAGSNAAICLIAVLRRRNVRVDRRLKLALFDQGTGRLCRLYSVPFAASALLTDIPIIVMAGMKEPR